jgi:glycosyltransferase involved in cell wall biosynthesis
MTPKSKPAVIVSCIGKFHAFALAEQLQMRQNLAGLYTAFAWQKNNILRSFSNRIDKEIISPDLIYTNPLLALFLKTFRRDFEAMVHFDRWVANAISKRTDYDVFIGWSGMSLLSIKQAKKKGKITILERGSSHILFQNAILQEEYKQAGEDFSIDPRIIDREIQEYALCDYISVPSDFVKSTFLEQGFQDKKIIMNPYGASGLFRTDVLAKPKDSFRILYLGSLIRRKGLKYLFQSLHTIGIPPEKFEVWFIGSISDEIKIEIEQYKMPNWKFWGHVPQHELPQIISQCDVGIQPSIEEGLSMVIPQMLGCGIPVIATANSGGENIIENGETGYIIPIRSGEAIASKIEFLYENPDKLTYMKSQAKESVKKGFKWDDYGDRYLMFLNSLK